MNSVFFAHPKTGERFGFHNEILTKVASISIAFETTIVGMTSLTLLCNFERDGASNSLRFFERREAGMTEPRGKCSFNFGLDCKSKQMLSNNISHIG